MSYFTLTDSKSLSRSTTPRRLFGGYKSKIPKINMDTMHNKYTDNPRITVYEFTAETYKHYPVEVFSSIPDPSPADGNIIRWINSDGYNDDVLDTLHGKYGFHSVAISDIFEDTPQRPNFAPYPNYIFMTFQVIKAVENSDCNEREQISMFVSGNTVITIQEGKDGDSWNPVRKDIINSKSKIRLKSNVGYLTYCLVDRIIDELFPIVRSYGDFLEETELEMFDDPLNSAKIQQVRALHRELQMLRRVVSPTKVVIEKMIAPAEFRWLDDDSISLSMSTGELEPKERYHFPANNRAYMREISDNIDRIIDLIDTYKEICTSLEAQFSQSHEHRTNQTMYTLTVVSTIFLPLTFLAGVYGTNFQVFPELGWEYGYVYFWCLILSVFAFTLTLLKYKRSV